LRLLEEIFRRVWESVVQRGREVQLDRVGEVKGCGTVFAAGEAVVVFYEKGESVSFRKMESALEADGAGKREERTYCAQAPRTVKQKLRW